MTEGTIYILINEAMPGYVKVGKTTAAVEQRMRELDGTGVPLPFECFYAARVSDLDFVERKLHDAFDDLRVRPRREFFRIDPERVQSALELTGGKDVTPRDDVVEDADDQDALNRARERRAGFNFKMVEVPVGAELTFAKDEQIKCVVVDNKRVEFEGEVTSLTASALEVIHLMGYTWTKIAGPSYWEYEGETLTARRLRMEEAD
jgi:hypothetical protein